MAAKSSTKHDIKDRIKNETDRNEKRIKTAISERYGARQRRLARFLQQKCHF